VVLFPKRRTDKIDLAEQSNTFTEACIGSTTTYTLPAAIILNQLPSLPSAKELSAGVSSPQTIRSPPLDLPTTCLLPSRSRGIRFTCTNFKALVLFKEQGRPLFSQFLINTSLESGDRRSETIAQDQERMKPSVCDGHGAWRSGEWIKLDKMDRDLEFRETQNMWIGIRNKSGNRIP